MRAGEKKEKFRRGARRSTAALVILLAGCGQNRASDRSAVARTDTSAFTESRAAQLRAGVKASAQSDGDIQKRATIVFAGTSLTAGLGLDPDSAYPMLVQRKIDSAGLPFQVVNAGVSGETSSGLVDRLDWLLRGQFDVFVIETGANDGLRGIPASTLRTNLETAIDRVRAKRPNATVVLIQMEALPNLGAKYTSEFHAVFPAVAREKGATLLPFLLDGVAGRRALNQGDGVHPNIVGERMVAANVWRGLAPLLEARAKQASGER